MLQLNLKQLDQIQSILKIYVVTSGLFDSDENGTFTNRDNEVNLPGTDLTITYNQIDAIRSIIKKEIYRILETLK